MKQEQLSLETCQEIGHLFPDSRSALYNGPHDEPTLLEKNGSIAWDKLCDHPSITDMMKWLWKKRLYIRPAIYDCGWEMESAIEALHRPIQFKADSLIEAYAEAVKIVLKENEK